MDSKMLNQSLNNVNTLYNYQTPYANYLNYSQSIKSSIKQLNSKNLWHSMEGDHRPWINEKSKKIANSKKTSNISVHNRLHQNALSKQKIRQRQGQNHSFSIEKRFDINDLNQIESNTNSKKKRRKNKSMNAAYKPNSNY